LLSFFFAAVFPLVAESAATGVVNSPGEGGRVGADGPPGLLSQPIKTKDTISAVTLVAPVRTIREAKERIEQSSLSGIPEEVSDEVRPGS
jgi:hypothetical protein